MKNRCLEYLRPMSRVAGISPAGPADRKRRRSLGLFLCVAVLFAQGSAVRAQQETDDNSTTTVRSVRLKPIIRKESEEVRLKPILKGTQSPQEQTEPGAPERPAPTNAEPVRRPPAQRLTPREQWPVQQGSVKLDPAKVERAKGELVRARALMARGSSEAARSQLLALEPQLEGRPEGAEARYLAAQALNDIEQARNELRDLVLKYPWAPVTPDALSRIGELSFILGDYEESLRAYRAWREIATRPEQQREADVRIALSLLQSGQFEEAETALAKLTEASPEMAQSPELIEAHADALMALGRYDEAAQEYREMGDRFPNYQFGVKVLMNRGLCAELSGDFEKAESLYRTLLETYPGSIEASMATERLRDLSEPVVPPTIRGMAPAV